MVAGNAGRATPNILEHADFEGTRSSTNSSNSAPESPENVLTALPAPSPISLPSGFWQALLYGSRDALVPAPRTPQRYTSDNISAWQGFQCGPIQRQRSGQHAAQNARWVGSRNLARYEQTVASSSGQSRCAHPERRPEALWPRSKGLSALHAGLAAAVPSRV